MPGRTVTTDKTSQAADQSGLTWDLTKLYASTADWEEDLKKTGPLLESFMALKGTLAGRADNIAESFRRLDTLETLLEKLHVYAHLKSDEDTANSENTGRLDRVNARCADISGETAWHEPEILAMDDKTLETLRDAPGLAFYRRTMEELIRSKKHTLSEKEERILGMASDIFSSPYKTYSLLSNADMRFAKIRDGKGVRKELTHGNYTQFLEESDRSVRRSAFNAMCDAHSKLRNTMAATLASMVKAHALDAKLRGYPSALEASLDDDNVPRSVYENLISSVRRRLPALHKYFALRARVMGLEKLDMCDLRNPLVPEHKAEVTWERAKEMTLDALLPLGDDYTDIVKKAFAERWIDVPERRGKRSGAYSSGAYRTPPYILMNFNGSLDDVFTLAHEMGHSLHSYYSDQALDCHYAGYSIFVAEVASTANELLLHKKLLAGTEDKKARLYLLNHLADEIRTTVFRQTMFAEFEMIIHERAESDAPLTADSLCKIYYDLNKEYHGPVVSPAKRIEIEWARIPHFYYDFYVYKYATGFSAAAALSKNILSGDAKLLDAYKGFLRAGSSKDPIDILRDAGADMSKPASVDAALDEFERTVDELAQGFAGQ